MDKKTVFANQILAFELLAWAVTGRWPLPFSKLAPVLDNEFSIEYHKLSAIAELHYKNSLAHMMPTVTLGIDIDNNPAKIPFIRQGDRYQMRWTKTGLVVGEIPPDSAKSLTGTSPEMQRIVNVLHDLINLQVRGEENIVTIGRLMQHQFIKSHFEENKGEYPEAVRPYMLWLFEYMLDK